MNTIARSSPKDQVIKLYKQLEDAGIGGKHNFLVHVANSEADLTDVLSKTNEDQHKYMLSATKKKLLQAVKSNHIPGKSKQITIEALFKDLDLHPGFDQDYNKLIHYIGPHTNGTKIFFEKEYGIESTVANKLMVLGITTREQFDALRKRPEAQAILWDICVKAGFTKINIEKIKGIFTKEMLLTTDERNCIDEIFGDLEFAKLLENKLSSIDEKKYFVAYRKVIQKEPTDNMYKKMFFHRYYKPFAKGVISRSQNKTEFVKEKNIKKFFNEVVQKDIKRAIRYTTLNDPSGGIIQNGGKTKIEVVKQSGKIKLTFPNDSLIDSAAETLHNLGSTAKVTPKKLTITHSDGTVTEEYLNGKSELDLDISEVQGSSISTDFTVEPLLKMYSENGNIPVEFTAPLQTVVLENDKNELNNLLKNVDETIDGPDDNCLIFTSNINVSLDTSAVSKPLTVSGLSKPSFVTVQGGQFSIDGRNWYDATKTDVKVSNGDKIRMRVQSSDEHETVTEGSVTINHKQALFRVKTEAKQELVKTASQPTDFTITPKNDQALDTDIFSDETITIAGLRAGETVPVHVTGGQVEINAVIYPTATHPIIPEVGNGHLVRLVLRSSTNNTTTSSMTANIGGRIKTFQVKTEALATLELPTIAEFGKGKGLAGNQVTSPALSVTGLTRPATIAIGGGEYRINGGLWTTAPGTIVDKQLLEVRGEALPNVGNIKKVSVNIGAATKTFEVETVQSLLSPETPDDFDLGNSEGVSISTITTPNVVKSKSVQIKNITRPTEVNCASGAFTVDGGATRHPAGTTGVEIQPNGFLQVRIAASTEYAEETIATVGVGNKSSDFIVKTIDAPEILEKPTISEPGPWVFSNNPVIVKGTAKNDSFVELSDSTGRTLGIVKAVGGEWTLSVGRFPVGNHTLRAVACDINGTPDPTRYTEISFEVGEVGLQTVTATRTEINAVVYGETGKQVTIGYKKPGETTWSERSEMMTTNPQTFTRHGLDLTHGTYEVKMTQGTIVKTDTFTINAHRVLPDTTRLPTSQDRNPVFHGTAEPNEVLEVKYLIPGSSDPNDPKNNKTITVTCDGAGERSFTLPDTITGVYDLKLSCAGENHTINYTSEGVSRRPVMDKSDLTIKNSDKDFTLSGFIDRRDLDCESVAIFDEDTEIARVPLGKFSMKNLVTRNRSTNSAFSATLPASLILDNKSKVFTIKPVRNGAVIDKDNISTVTVTKVEDMRDAPREALKTARVEFNQPDGSKPQVTLSGKLTQTADAKHKIKKIGIRRHTRGAGRVIKRDYQTVGVNDDGTWSVEKLFKNNGKYTYAAAPVIDAEPISGTWLRKSKEVLGKTTYCPFEVQAEANEGRTKRYNPFSWFKKKNKSGSTEESGDKKADKKGGDGDSESGSGGSKRGFFSRLKGLLNGDFLPEPNKSEGKSIVQRGKNIVNGDNDLVKALEGKNSESK